MPASCTSFDGPHSLACLNDLFTGEGCLFEGTGYPGSLLAHEISALQSKTIT